jgi:hypothetical protein
MISFSMLLLVYFYLSREQTQVDNKDLHVYDERKSVRLFC